jgi:hypothetical protein
MNSRFHPPTLFPPSGGEPVFAPWPIMHEPRPHQSVIPFTGMQGWLLWTPAEGFQPAGQVMCVVAHAEGHENHRTDAQERPPIGVKARLEGSLLEDRQHALPLLHAQAGRATRNRACVQAGHVALVLVELSSPLADRHPTDTQSAGNVSVGELPSLEQPSSFQASFFTLTTGELFWAPDHGHLL